MQPVLILTETDKISQHKIFLTNAVLSLQLLYDKLKAIDATPTIDDLQTLSVPDNFTAIKSQIDGFVGDKMMDKAGTPAYGGVPIKREKLRDMLDMPDTSDVVLQVEGIRLFSRSNPNFWLEVKYLEIVNDKVMVKADAFAGIEARYTYYTKNDKGAEIATKLNVLIPALNTYVDYLSPNMAASFKRDLDFESLGVQNNSGKLTPALGFIRDQEASYPNYVAS